MDTERHWGRIGDAQRLGVMIPLFSVRSRRQVGIGDSADLFALTDWCAQVGMSVIQILPINDMGMDNIPYCALSAFALDPVYLALDRVREIMDDPDLSLRLDALREALKHSVRVDYAAVRAGKMGLLRAAFAKVDPAVLRDRLRQFATEHPWLDGYVLYRAIKEVEAFHGWEDWGPRYADEEQRRDFAAEHADDMAFFAWLQLLLCEQFGEARAYANARGVLIEGDIPILVSRDSADCWLHPELFHMDASAGAPPDLYAADGQNWGFPTYDWDALRRTDYAWWRGRLRHAARFFDLYRIDHVVGFFRIWTIAKGMRNGREGQFVPADEGVWEQHGRTLLRMMVESCDMLPLAEDLGTVPPVARKVLAEMGICGLKVQRWERRWNEDRSFIDPSLWSPLSVATLSTHDSETLAGWWETSPDDRVVLARTLGFEGEVPARLPGAIERAIVRWLRRTPSRFVVLAMQDLLSPLGLLPGKPSDHRVNVPGVVDGVNWTWRCPMNIEDLSDVDRLQAMRSLLASES